MSLLTENAVPVGLEGGDQASGEAEGAALEILTLPIPVEWMRFCDVCQEERRFVAGIVLANGLLGECSSCGDVRVAAFTRVNSEVA